VPRQAFPHLLNDVLNAIERNDQKRFPYNWLEELSRERSGFRALMKDLNQKPTLNFLTDEGLLPNYAFPEAGVTLKQVMATTSDRDGAGMGLVGTLNKAGKVVGPLLGGLLIEQFGFAVSIQLIGVLVLLGATLVWFWQWHSTSTSHRLPGAAVPPSMTVSSEPQDSASCVNQR
jgi:hypothetical protein